MPKKTEQKTTEPKATEPEVLLGKGGATEAGWHSIESFLRCPKSYQFKHIRKLREPQTQTPDHFAFGQMFHAGRARWFSLKFETGTDAWEKVLEAVAEAREEANLPVSHKAERNVLRHLEAYMQHYSIRPKPTPIAAEYKLGPVPLIDGDPFFLYRTARLDDVSKYPEHGGRLLIGESKTTSTSLDDTVNQYELHGQTMLQALLWRNDPQGAAKYGKVDGVLMDVVIKAQSDKDRPKFGRQFVPITDHQLNWFAHNLRNYLMAAAGVGWDTITPRNPSGCTYMAGRARIPCEFRDICRYGKSAAGKFVFADGSSVAAWKPSDDKQTPPWL
jgi:hypothetical protein